MSYCIVITHCLFPCTCNNKKLRFCPQTLSSHNKLIWQDKTRTKLWQGWGVHNRSNFLPGLPKDGGGRTPLLHDCHSSKDHSITTKQPCLCNILTEFPLPPLQWLKVVSEVIFFISFHSFVKVFLELCFNDLRCPLRCCDSNTSLVMMRECIICRTKGLHLSVNQGEGILWLQLATLLAAKLKSINSKFHHEELTRLTSQIDHLKKRFQSIHVILLAQSCSKTFAVKFPKKSDILPHPKLIELCEFSLSHATSSETVVRGPFWAQSHAFLMCVPKSILHLLLMSNHFTILCFSNVFPHPLQYCAFTVASSITVT